MDFLLDFLAPAKRANRANLAIGEFFWCDVLEAEPFPPPLDISCSFNVETLVLVLIGLPGPGTPPANPCIDELLNVWPAAGGWPMDAKLKPFIRRRSF